VAALLAFVLGVGGYVFAGNWFGASDPVPGPSSSRTVPSKPTTTSKAVTAEQSRGVVLVEAETAGGTAFGTGMVLTPDGKVLTNYHVVAGTTKVAATIATSGDTYVATVLGFDQTRDVALLQLKDASGLATVTLDNDPVAVGDSVAAVGNANGGMKLVKAAGTVTGTNQPLTVSSDSPWGNSEDLQGLVATNAGAVPGDSGGPMFDAQNEVLGMTTAGSVKEHASYAIPIATAVGIVNQI
jgi:S1-C subfamily serine protease